MKVRPASWEGAGRKVLKEPQYHLNPFERTLALGEDRLWALLQPTGSGSGIPDPEPAIDVCVDIVRKPSRNAGVESVQPTARLQASLSKGFSTVEGAVKICCKLVSEVLLIDVQHWIQEGSAAAVFHPQARQLDMFVIEIKEH